RGRRTGPAWLGLRRAGGVVGAVDVGHGLRPTLRPGDVALGADRHAVALEQGEVRRATAAHVERRLTAGIQRDVAVVRKQDFTRLHQRDVAVPAGVTRHVLGRDDRDTGDGAAVGRDVRELVLAQ